MCNVNWFVPEGEQPVTITDISLEVQTCRRVDTLMKASKTLPSLPEGPLSDGEVLRYMKGLTTFTASVCEVLDFETDAERAAYRKPPQDRVQLLVIAHRTLVGRVDGNRRIYDARGNMVSDGRS